MDLQRRGRARREGPLLSATNGLNARQVGELVAELAPLVVGLPVAEVAALPPRDVLLVLDNTHAGAGGGPAVLRLRVSADPEGARVHLQQGRMQRHAGGAAPFYQRLAHELVGGTLYELVQVRADRIVRLGVRRAEGGRVALLAELVGRHGNLILVDGDDRVLDLLVPTPAGKAGGAPRLVPGRPWQPPPGRAGSPDEQVGVLEAFPTPAHDPPAVAAGHPQRAPLSWRVEAALGAEVLDRDLELARRKLARRLTRRLANARSNLSGLERRLAASGEAERARQDGELVKAHLGSIRRGMRELAVPDWFVEGAPQRTLVLDPSLDPVQNAEKFFARAKKLERARANLPEELERASRRAGALEELLARVETPDSDPEALAAEALERGLLEPEQEGDPRKRKAPAPRLPYRTFEGCRGSLIRVGRTAKDNDELTFRHARGNDLWLHTADHPGSHVVLVLAKNGEADPEEVLDAAHLAVHFSPARDARRAAVHVAPRKLVHKPKGAKPGLVTLSGGRTLELRVQPERLQRLLARQRPSGEDSGAS